MRKETMFPVSYVFKKAWSEEEKTFQITFIPPFAPFATHKTSFLCHVATHSRERVAPRALFYYSSAVAMLVFIGESSEQIGNSWGSTTTCHDWNGM